LADLARLEGVGSAVMAARDAVDAVLRDRGRRQVSAEQQADALLRAARANSDLGDLEDFDPSDGHDGPGWAAGTLRLYTDLAELATLVRTSPLQAVARAHTVLAHGLVAEDDLGRIRSDPTAADRMTSLGRLLAAPTAAPVIVVAAVAHAELITVQPFSRGNGIVARAVEHMIMVAGDLDRPPVTVPELGHLQSGTAYRRALDGYRTGTAEGVRDWLLHAAAAVTRGAELSPLRPVNRSRGRVDR
jgi:hypothetical protein